MGEGDFPVGQFSPLAHLTINPSSDPRCSSHIKATSITKGKKPKLQASHTPIKRQLFFIPSNISCACDTLQLPALTEFVLFLVHQATPDMAVTLLEIARIFATKVPGKIDADVLQLLWKVSWHSYSDQGWSLVQIYFCNFCCFSCVFEITNELLLVGIFLYHHEVRILKNYKFPLHSQKSCQRNRYFD